MKKIIEYKNGKVLTNGVARIRDKKIRKQDHDVKNQLRQAANYDPSTSHHKVTVIKQ